MHFIYYINSQTATTVDSTYLGCLASNTQRTCPVAGLERMTTGSVVPASPYRVTQYLVYSTKNAFFSQSDRIMLTAHKCTYCNIKNYTLCEIINVHSICTALTS